MPNPLTLTHFTNPKIEMTLYVLKITIKQLLVFFLNSVMVPAGARGAQALSAMAQDIKAKTCMKQILA